MPRRYDQPCPVANSLEILGDRWTLLIVRDLIEGPRRFQDLQASLRGIAPNVLSDRLKRLEREGIARRRPYREHPPRSEYLLTRKGRDLEVVVGALGAWGSRHVSHDHRLVHRACGQPIVVRFRCPHCDAAVRSGEARVQHR